jgi:hypothetical protein
LLNEGEGDAVKLVFDAAFGETLGQISLFQEFLDAPL